MAAGVICLFGAASAWCATAYHTPYIQNVGDTRATVIWSTRENVASSVQYSTDQSFGLRSQSTVRQLPISETNLNFPIYQHRAELTGLAPGTEYSYRIVMADGTNLVMPGVTNLSTHPDYRFRSAGPGPMTFLVFGDSGSGSPDQQQITGTLVKERPNFVVHVGDMAYEDGNHLQFQANYFEYYQLIMRRAPFFPAPGNHEYYTQRAAPYLALHAVPSETVPEIDRGRYYSFDWGAAHFVSLDSNLLDSGITAARMIEWLEQDLSRSKAPWKIVFFHHLPYPLEHHLDDPYAAMSHSQLVPVLEKHNVQLVFTGHEHTYMRTKPLRGDVPVSSGRGTVYVTTGGAGGQGHGAPMRDFVARAMAVYHYLRVEADESRITIRAVDKDGRVLDTAFLANPSLGSETSVVNGASFAPAIASGAMVSIFGKGLSVDTRTASTVPLPEALGGTSVTVNGEPAPVYYVSPDQINAQLRMDQQGPAVLRVTTASGTAEVTVNIAEAAPGIFPGGVVHASGRAITAEDPARAGETVIIYASGLGEVTSRIASGFLSPALPLAYCAIPVTVQIGGASVSPDFAGLAPSFVGLYQVNVKLPATLAPGAYPLRLTSRGNSSNAVTVPVAP
jgi:acid phosphatase type 7